MCADTSLAVISEEDEGNASVAMDSSTYRQKMADSDGLHQTPRAKAHLAVKTFRDPTGWILRLSSYGLPKIYQENLPLRPIVSAIGAPTSNMAKYLTKLLSPFVGIQLSLWISWTLYVRLAPSDLFVSLDIVSLFTCSIM